MLDSNQVTQHPELRALTCDSKHTWWNDKREIFKAKKETLPGIKHSNSLNNEGS